MRYCKQGMGDYKNGKLIENIEEAKVKRIKNQIKELLSEGPVS